MPEGDAVWRTAKRLHETLAGRTLTTSDFRVPALATLDLRGRRTIEVVPRGKHLLHRVEGGVTVHSHLRMDGRWITRPRGPQDPTPRRHTVRVVLGTAGQWAVGDRLGMLDAVPTTRENRVVGHLGPDLLDPATDVADATSRVRREPDVEIALALLDQRNLAGIGTIFASEPLFLCRVDPWAPVGSLPESTVLEVITLARDLLIDSCREGRTSTGPQRLPDGSGEATWVFGREGRACLRCRTPIRMRQIGAAPQARDLAFCPRCQVADAPAEV